MPPMVATNIVPHFGRLRCAFFTPRRSRSDNLGEERLIEAEAPALDAKARRAG